jgi:integrase
VCSGTSVVSVGVSWTQEDPSPPQSGSVDAGYRRIFYRRAFKPAVHRLVDSGRWPGGLARLRFHDLRHSAAALMIANGEHPKVIQERLGHASNTITMDRYGKLYPDHDAEVTERLEDTLASAQLSTVTPIVR